ncbi:Protein of unknown function [Quadrisphaera granulorum]|uniref:Uncharacterized protein DUF4233 n=1 Tax=Quadrisphaera granulorum TaxID=317664 RepID=A0A316A8W2_9ACTN|nr:DUF4233 domain-containing protein [Quadrisphaera granulorum]PWJ53962.1 uncharacterized protein DUF4233 [Quadrisphaera granulorum]SZE96419.1 Protein of unknown function [Quadrisphaera granulorum]
MSDSPQQPSAPEGQRTGQEHGQQGDLTVPPPTMTARLASTTLLLEAFAVLFGTMVAAAFLPPLGVGLGWVWGIGLALVVVCVLATGTARSPRGVVIGNAVQVLLVAVGVVLAVLVFEAGIATLVVAIGFAALWWWLVSIGRRIDTDRRRWAAQLAEQQR